MSRMNLQSASVDKRFRFGSPPLLNGFSTFNTCRMEEGFPGLYNSDCCADQLSMRTSAYNNGYNHSVNLLESLNQMSFYNQTLEQGNKKPAVVFKKRKDLRTLQNVLSKERYREVVMKFGDGGEEGAKEILASVHNTMKHTHTDTLKCIFCPGQTQVYENFPVVDGTLFLTPVRLSGDCVSFSEKANSSHTRYMCYVCVKCLEGTPKPLRCRSCKTQWNGSFFQVGTLYSYNILSAIPCCQEQFTCNQCSKGILDFYKGEASSLFFSHFSKKTECPHCRSEDFHFVKPLIDAL